MKHLSWLIAASILVSLGIVAAGVTCFWFLILMLVAAHQQNDALVFVCAVRACGCLVLVSGLSDASELLSRRIERRDRR